MSLQDRLNALRASFEAKQPQQVLDIMHGATDALRRSGILARMLKIGDPAPAFVLPNAHDEPVASRRLLERGPLVITFYRGAW